jgi:hypothetical protein
MIRLFLKRSIQNYRTTAAGCAMIGAAVIAVIHDPASLGTPPLWIGFFGGIGLICGQDAGTGMAAK